MLPTFIQRYRGVEKKKGMPYSRKGRWNVVKIWIPSKLLFKFNTVPFKI